MNIITMNMINPEPGKLQEKDEHLFDTKKVVHSKDDVKPINNFLKSSKSEHKPQTPNVSTKAVSGGSAGGKYGVNQITGKTRTSSPEGFRVSAKCRPEIALGHNKRDPNWIKDRENVDPTRYHKTYLDFDSVKKVYDELFKDAVEEYNNRQTRNDRKIDDYYKKLMEDGRNGTMKKRESVDTHRKPIYEFIFQIGRRDLRLDTATSIKILEKFSTEYMPEHFPNLKAVGIYLHADEITEHPVTHEILEGAVHVHFDYIPIAHALSKDELKEEKKWRKELEQQARAEAKAKGEKFSKTKFDEQDWSFMRAKKFGKALQKGMLLQSSMSGACAEMGFRTKGKLTAQIQMEEAVRLALMDFAESYGVRINRDLSEEKQEEVSIDEFKAREDNKVLLQQIESELQKNKAIQKENQKTSAELTAREENVKNLEAEKADVEKREKEAKALEATVAPYVERIDTLVEDEKAVKQKKVEQAAKDEFLDKKAEQIKTNEAEALNRIAEKQAEVDSSISDFAEVVKTVEADKKSNAENEKINSHNAEQNEANAKEIKRKVDDFYDKESQYRMLKSVCGHADEITVNVQQLGEELKTDLRDSSLTWREAVDKGVNNFTKKCHQILIKFQDTIRGFKNFLEGKTSKDFRELADDMDRNGTRTFEDYEKKYMEEKLDWQVQQRVQRYTLKATKKKVNEIERD